MIVSQTAKTPYLKTIVLFVFLFFSGLSAFGQANITIEVNWPFWSSENRVTFRDPSNNPIGASICNPGSCFNGCCNNAYNNIGSPASFPGIAYGTGYDIFMEDTWGDGWNGSASYVRVYQDGVLIVDTDLTGSSGTFTFDILAPTPTLTIDDVTVNEGDGTAIFTVTHTGAAAAGPLYCNLYHYRCYHHCGFRLYTFTSYPKTLPAR